MTDDLTIRAIESEILASDVKWEHARGDRERAYWRRYIEGLEFARELLTPSCAWGDPPCDAPGLNRVAGRLWCAAHTVELQEQIRQFVKLTR